MWSVLDNLIWTVALLRKKDGILCRCLFGPFGE